VFVWVRTIEPKWLKAQPPNLPSKFVMSPGYSFNIRSKVKVTECKNIFLAIEWPSSLMIRFVEDFVVSLCLTVTCEDAEIRHGPTRVSLQP